MSSVSSPRVQFVVSGKFLVLLLIAAGLLGGGFYWYLKQQEIQKRFRTPGYFVNRGPSIIRPCKQCLELGKLKPQSDWTIGQPNEIPATEQRWFLAVEDPPTPVTIAGVLMLPVHPALRDNPAFGFDQSQVMLVLYQGLQRMAAIEQPSPPPPAQPPSVADADRTAEPAPKPDATSVADRDMTPSPGLNIMRLGQSSWRVELPADNEWYRTGIPVIAPARLLIRPMFRTSYGQNEAWWSAGLGEYIIDIPTKDDPHNHELDQELTEDLPFVTGGPDWLTNLHLRVRQHSISTLTLDVELQIPELAPGTGHSLSPQESWEQHLQRHQQTRLRVEELLKKP